MRFINNIRNSLFLGVCGLFLFTGCSQKNVSGDYTKFYKDTKNSKINNSPQMHKYTMRPYNVFGIKYYPQLMFFNKGNLVAQHGSFDTQQELDAFITDNVKY